MSVLMVLKIPVGAAGMEAAMGDHRDLLLGIADESKKAGAVHHAFYEGADGGMIVVDEWDSPESFQSFYEAQGPKIGQLMGAAGAEGEPDPPRFYRKLALGDEF